MKAMGIDACGKRGWVGILLIDGTYGGSMVEFRLDALIARVADCDAIAVDMPLGLAESDWRAADLHAREFLGPARRNSVFLTPPRAVWDEPDYAAASDRCRSILGKGISRQAYALGPKLREARTCWIADPERIHEVHPEVSFQALAGGDPLPYAKKSWRGQALRRSLLAAAGVLLPEALGEADSVPPDDILDAAAAAWSALRIATGSECCLPAVPEQDIDGRTVAIRY
jgi:predicted RNase H-like nuclease